MKAHEMIHWRLRRGCGKVNVELARSTRPGRKQKKPDYVFVISREEIKLKDFSRLRSEFDLESPREKLRGMIGSVTFAIAGYEDLSEELFEIPDVRAYFARVNCHWPLWLAFCQPASNAIRVFAT
jgi:hypothetical protein